MRIVAAVASYDEPPGFLERLTSSLEHVVDEVVHLDGRWDELAGEGEARWPSQVAKRAELMEAAGAAGDWVIVIDGDEFVERADGDAIRAALEASALDVAEVAIRNMNRKWPHSQLAPTSSRARRIFRAGTAAAGPEHDDYALDGVPLAGRSAKTLPEALDLTACLVVAHDNRSRPAEREQAIRVERKARRRRSPRA